MPADRWHSLGPAAFPRMVGFGLLRRPRGESTHCKAMGAPQRLPPSRLLTTGVMRPLPREFHIDGHKPTHKKTELSKQRLQRGHPNIRCVGCSVQSHLFVYPLSPETVSGVPLCLCLDTCMLYLFTDNKEIAEFKG
eukprot:755885-Amphidinium_carterae.1